MKKVLGVAILLLLFSVSFVFSQDKEFYEKTQIISPILGVNSYTVPFGANFEYGITENVGIGGTAMYWSWGGRMYSNSLISLSADAAYHFTSLEVDKLDLFAGGGLGISIYSYSWKSGYDGGVYGGAGSSGLFLEPFAGARYYFSPKISGFTRLHVNVVGSWAGVGGVLGVSFRLK
ncbi:hypothetical protein KGY73_05780 [bacterium]|nr:hypothetical protein [bacterium]